MYTYSYLLTPNQGIIYMYVQGIGIHRASTADDNQVMPSLE